MITAVDDSTKPLAPMIAAWTGKPPSMATPDSKAQQSSTWAAPRPKISLRSDHSLAGRISSPMMNRNITTPSSATWRIASGSANSLSPNGPITRPAAR